MAFLQSPMDTVRSLVRWAMSSPQYQYAPLAHPDAEIRLAEVYPGSYGDELCVSFVTRRLEETEPQYEAISYCWGSIEDPSHVCVDTKDGKRISITQNLGEALRHFRFANKRRLLWADALCIDQVSAREKNYQVGLMGEIYSKAKHTLIWIGPEQDGSSKALEILQLLSDRISYDWNNCAMRPKGKCSRKEMHWGDPHETLPYKNRELNAVHSLFERPYFSRTWIRQETVLASDATLHCGGRTLPWECFREAVACLYRKGFHYTAISRDRIIAFDDIRKVIYQLCDLGTFSITYSTLRQYFGSTECQDPRDKIFAALSILDVEDRVLGITPDYSRDVAELYTDVARRQILGSRSLALLSSCILSAADIRLPSWVPDWSSKWPVTDPMNTAWSACGWISAHVSVRDEDSICVAGVSVARISAFQYISPELDKENAQVFAVLQKFRSVAKQAGALNSTKWRSRVPALFRKSKPAAERGATRHSTGRQWAETLVKALLRGLVAEFHWPRRTDKIPMSKWLEALDIIWSSKSNYNEIDSKTKTKLIPVLRAFFTVWQGLSVFHATNGYVGLAHANIQEGDVICILLGNMFPVVLRQTLGAQSDPAWKVVSTCCVPGLMDGEIIYDSRPPSTWETVTQSVMEYDYCIDGWGRAIHDTATHALRTDPAAILTELGIKVESYQRKPHRLEVLPETLRAAGVALQDFVLV